MECSAIAQANLVSRGHTEDALNRRVADGIEQEDAYARVAGVLPASRQP